MQRNHLDFKMHIFIHLFIHSINACQVYNMPGIARGSGDTTLGGSKPGQWWAVGGDRYEPQGAHTKQFSQEGGSPSCSSQPGRHLREEAQSTALKHEGRLDPL